MPLQDAIDRLSRHVLPAERAVVLTQIEAKYKTFKDRLIDSERLLADSRISLAIHLPP